MIGLLPESVLFTSGLLVLLFDIRRKDYLDKQLGVAEVVGIFGFILALILTCLFFPSDTTGYFLNNYRVDRISQIFKCVLIFAGGFSAVLGVFPLKF